MTLFDRFLPTVAFRAGAALLPLLAVPASAHAQSTGPLSLRVIDLLLLGALSVVGSMLWLLRRRLAEDRASRERLLELLEAQAAPEPLLEAKAALEPATRHVAATRTTEAEDTGSSTSRPEPLPAEERQQIPSLERVLEAQTAMLNQLAELVRESQATSSRLSEVRTSLQEGGGFAKYVQKLHKETILGVERVHVTLSGLVSAFEALKVSDRRDAAQAAELSAGISQLNTRLAGLQDGLQRLEALEGHTDGLREQLGELQADIGLVLKARPIRRPGHGRSPYDVSVADEYFANLQKLIRVAMKNDKASTYALEAIQYLHESLQLQASLCEVLSSAEFALRVAPQALEEGVVKPLLRSLRQTPPGGTRALEIPTPPAARNGPHNGAGRDVPTPDQETLTGDPTFAGADEDADAIPDLSGIEPMVPAWDGEPEEVPAASELNRSH